MMIEIKGKNYEVIENEKKWKIQKEDGKVKLVYEVSKKDCKTQEELKRFITDNNLF